MSDGGYKTMEKAFFEAQDEIDRLKNELKEAHVATDFANLACDRKDEEIVRLNVALEAWKNEFGTDDVKESAAEFDEQYRKVSKLESDLHARDKALVEAVCALQPLRPLTDKDDLNACLEAKDQERRKAIATINSLLGDKCGVAAPPPDNQKGGS